MLHGNLNNIWTTSSKSKFSWFTNRLLKTSNLAFDWIKVKVGNGTSVKFWTDNWSPMGKLLDFLTPRRLNTMGIPLTATLADIYTGERWNIAPARSEKQIQVQAFLTTITLTKLRGYLLLGTKRKGIKEV